MSNGEDKSGESDPWRLVHAYQTQVAELMAVIGELRETNTELRGAIREMREARDRPELGHDLIVSKLRDLYEPVICSKATATQISNRGHLAPVVEKFGDRAVLSIRLSEYEEFMNNELPQKETVRGKPYAQSTRAAIHHIFMAAVNWAVRDKRLAKNPFIGAKKPKMAKRKSTISRTDEPAVLSAANSVMGEMFVVSVDCGTRLNEVRNLEWDWIDLDAKRLSIPEWLPKNRQARDVILTDRAVQALRDRPRMLRCPYVWPNPDTGKPYSKSAIDEWWSRVRDEAGLKPAAGEENVKLHGTRHTAATRMAKVASVAVVARQLGQTKAVCLDYIHADDEDAAAMMAELDKMSEISRRSPQAAQTSSRDTPDARREPRTKNCQP